MTTRPESERDRDERHRQRTLFDGIAERYETSRPGYPTSVTEFVTTTTANLHPGAEILEIGCGTGQLTENLAGHGFRLTAIDIGPSMIATARRLCLADEQRATLTASEVIALESTRATLLSWPPPTQRRFTEELRRTLEPQPTVHLTRHTSVTMATRSARREGQLTR